MAALHTRAPALGSRRCPLRRPHRHRRLERRDRGPIGGFREGCREVAPPSSRGLAIPSATPTATCAPGFPVGCRPSALLKQAAPVSHRKRSTLRTTRAKTPTTMPTMPMMPPSSSPSGSSTAHATVHGSSGGGAEGGGAHSGRLLSVKSRRESTEFSTKQIASPPHKPKEPPQAALFSSQSMACRQLLQ